MPWVVTGDEIQRTDNIYAPSLSQEDVEAFISTILSYFSRVFEKESYPIEEPFEKMPSIDTLSVIFINLMKASENDKNSMALRSIFVAGIFFSLHGDRLLLSQDNHLVGEILQVLVDVIIISSITDRMAIKERYNAVRAIIYGAEKVSLTAANEHLLSKLENLVYSDKHTIERLSKKVCSTINSCRWFSELLMSAKDKSEKTSYLKTMLNSFSMTHEKISDLLQSIKSANSTKKHKEQKGDVKQLIFDVPASVKDRFEALYREQCKLVDGLTKKQLITDIIEAEYRKVFNVSRRSRDSFGVVFDEERDMHYPALVVHPERTAKRDKKTSRLKFARQYPPKKE